MIDINSISFTDEYTGSGATATNFLMGNVGDKMQAVVVCTVHWEVLGATVKYDSASKTITLQNMASAIGSSGTKSFINSGFRQGDSFTIVGGINAGNYTIASITDTTIVTNEALTSGVNTGVDFHGTTSVNAVNFYFNLIEKDAVIDFRSLTDAFSSQKKYAGVSATAWTSGSTKNLSIATNSQGWDTGSGTVLKTTTGYNQVFTITHTFNITPYFLSNQLSNFIHTYYPPDYFSDTKCLKYVCQLDAKFELNDPTIPHTTSNNINLKFNQGNTGWFDEFMNGKPADYTLTSISYKDNATSASMNRLDVGKDVDVTINIHSAAGSFVNKGAAAGSPIVVHFAYCPLIQDDYTNTQTTLEQNFLHDRAYTTIGATAVNGDNYGTNYQVLKNIAVTFTDANNAVVTFTVSWSSYIKTLLQGKSDTNRYYMIWVAPQKKTATSLLSTDRNNILCDIQNADFNQDDATMCIFNDTLFYQYPDTTTNSYTDYKGSLGDGVLAVSRFKFKKNATLGSAVVSIRAQDSVTGDQFDLETFNIDLNGLALSNNEVPDAIDNIREYKLQSTDPRNQISFRRYTPLDDADYFGYEIDYGFKLRYEDWRFLNNYSPQFVQDPSQRWSNYSTGPMVGNYKTHHAIRITNAPDLLYTHSTQSEHTSDITVYDDTHSSAGPGLSISTVIDTYTFDGGYIDAHGFISSDDNTHIVATFTGNFTSFPAGITRYGGVLSIDIEGQGGVSFVDQSSTEEALLSNSIWSTQAVVTKVNNTTITLTADIDFSKLDIQVDRYLLYARLLFIK